MFITLVNLGNNMHKYQTIYKRTSTGKVQIWFAESDGDRYRTTSGQLDGKKTTTEWTIAKPKNVGRSNETTGEEQAILEVQAEYEKKLARDYRREPDTVDELDRFKPMLATKWTDRKDKVSEPVFMQPKLDGVRCIANKDGLWTREGKPIYGAPHIIEALAPLFAKDSSFIFDGELYNHELKNDFNAIVSCVKKQTPSAADLEKSRELIQYWIYDMPSSKGTFSKRHENLHDVLWDVAQTYPQIDFFVTLVSTTYEEDLSKIDDAAVAWIESGFEGAMVRVDGPYENKRSKYLIKWKEMQDEEFEIVDIQEGDGNRAGMAARVVLKLKDSTFSAGMIGNVEYCKQFLKDKDQFIGKMGTVVFQNYTPDGVPRFPKFKGVRWEGDLPVE